MNKLSTKDKVSFILIIIFCVIVFSFVIYDQYSYTKLSEDDLIEKSIIFNNIEFQSKRTIIYDINGNAYGFNQIIDLDEELLKSIEQNDKVLISYVERNNKYFQGEIIEMSYEDNVVVTLNDYVSQYKEQVKVSLIVSICLIVFTVACFIITNKFIPKIVSPNSKEVNYDSEDNIKRYNQLSKLIKYDGKDYYANFDNEFNGDYDIEIISKVIYDRLLHDELLIIRDENAYDEVCYIGYRNNNKSFFIIGFINQNDFILDMLQISWTYPKFNELTDNELKSFIRQIKKYTNDNGYNLILEDAEE